MTRIFDTPGQCVTADVLVHTYNNAKGVGLVALLDSTPGGKGLALNLNDQGNADALQLATMDPATGQLTELKSVSLGAGIAENVWYRVNLLLLVDANWRSADRCSCTRRRRTATAPTGRQVGPELRFDGKLSTMGLEDAGEVGIAASAFSTNVSSSVTNWIAGCD